MSEQRIKKHSATDPRTGKTDWERLRKLSDEEIAEAIAKDPDAVPLDIDWSDAELVYPPTKKPVSIRIDEDILSFFKEGGSGYQTRINAVLRSYMEHARRDRE